MIAYQLVPFLNLCIFIGNLLSVPAPLDHDPEIVESIFLGILFRHRGFQCRNSPTQLLQLCRKGVIPWFFGLSNTALLALDPSVVLDDNVKVEVWE
jgi:hypothetical protein